MLLLTIAENEAQRPQWPVSRHPVFRRTWRPDRGQSILFQKPKHATLDWKSILPKVCFILKTNCYCFKGKLEQWVFAVGIMGCWTIGFWSNGTSFLAHCVFSIMAPHICNVWFIASVFTAFWKVQTLFEYNLQSWN